MFAFTFSDISLASNKSCFRLGVEILRLISKHRFNRLCLILDLVKKVHVLLFILLALDYVALSHRFFELFPFLPVIFWINISLELFRELSHRLFHLVLGHFEMVRSLFLLTLPLSLLFKFELLLLWGHNEHKINLLLFAFPHFELSV